jgi:Major capsid protein N-terminus/Large eukaryotic DNA virus major capsid protein
MGGGLLQLVAYGAQDAYLSGNPQITFWKGLFKRHTNFAMESFRVNLTGQANWGVKHSATLGRHADLAYSTYIEVVLPPGARINADGGRLGYNLIKYVELDIGGQIIDRLYGEWLFLWDCLSSDDATGKKLSQMVNGGFDTYTNGGVLTVPDSASCANGRPSKPTVIYIPLTFFYTKNPGAALPLIALQYHEVKLNILWNDEKMVNGNITPGSYAAVPPPEQAAVYVDYIYLDTEERRRMAQESHEYLIEQVQFNEEKGITSANNRIDLTFNHPVKELVWVVQPHSYTDCRTLIPAATPAQVRTAPFSYDRDAVYEQWLQINGQDRLDKRFGDYYNKVQPYQHHSGSSEPVLSIPSAAPSSAASGSLIRSLSTDIPYAISNPGIYMYSFALKPEEHQPSGTCNFSRIDTATLVMNLNGRDYSRAGGSNDIVISNVSPWNVRVYALNYNILRVMSGMAGLAYSN